jgi:hypothetical protein
MAATAQDILDAINKIQEDVNALGAKVDILLDAPKPTTQSFANINLADGSEGKVLQMEVNMLTVATNPRGEKAFKLKGHPYSKHGVAVYDDGNRFELMGIDSNTDFGDHKYNQNVTVLVREPEEEGKLPKPVKVLGLAE